MKEKFACKDLFVACEVSVVDYLIEPWVHYETFGKEYHDVVINPKKRVILKKEGAKGEIFYHRLSDLEKVQLCNPTSSWYSESSCMGTRYCQALSNNVRGIFNFGLNDMLSGMIKCIYHDRFNRLGFLVPFDEYIKSTLGLDINYVTKHQAEFLLSLTRFKQKDRFSLSDDEEIAQEQIDRMVFLKPNSCKIKTKKL